MNRGWELDDAKKKQILDNHCPGPDADNFDVTPILRIIEDILRLSTNIVGAVDGTLQEHMDTLEDTTNMAASDRRVLEGLGYIMPEISSEISKCWQGGDSHLTTIALLKKVSNRSWIAKVVILLAAFAAYYGEFLLVVQLYPKNSLAKPVALLKQLPKISEHSVLLKPRIDSLNKLIKAVLDLTKYCIVHGSIDEAYIITAVYQTIQSIVACATEISSLRGFGPECVTSNTTEGELATLADMITQIHDDLKQRTATSHPTSLHPPYPS